MIDREMMAQRLAGFTQQMSELGDKVLDNHTEMANWIFDILQLILAVNNAEDRSPEELTEARGNLIKHLFTEGGNKGIELLIEKKAFLEQAEQINAELDKMRMELEFAESQAN
jgi:hypothetical protein|tara:strand:- start:219 stop:557 length:339 start_codon:yes stop_codon:yes gene_type:complete